MISLSKLKQGKPVAMPPPTDDSFRIVLDQFEVDQGRDDPLWVAQRAAENSDESILIVLRAIEMYSRDRQLVLFDRINRGNSGFWQRAYEFLERVVYKSNIMVGSVL